MRYCIVTILVVQLGLPRASRPMFGPISRRRPKTGSHPVSLPSSEEQGDKAARVVTQQFFSLHHTSATMVVHLYGTLTPGNMFTFNTNDGYLEALLRGFRSGILSTADYANLIQCDQLEGEITYSIIHETN